MTATPEPTPDELIAAMPFAATLGVTLDSASPGLVRGTLSWARARCTVGNALHGGALMSLADSVGGICAYLNLPAGASTSTIQSASNFFRPVREGTVVATSRPQHVGRSTIVVQTELHDDLRRPVGLVTQTQAVIPASTTG